MFNVYSQCICTKKVYVYPKKESGHILSFYDMKTNKKKQCPVNNIA